MAGNISFKDQVVIVTGSGAGLGRAYALLFAARGAKVIINDFAKANADKVVAEIKSKGGEAIANYDSVTDGQKIVQQAVDKWGRLDVLINNAGFLRDKSFKGMSDKEWNDIQEVHVRAVFVTTKAAWPIMRKQKFGRIINASASGLYGSFGQANYSAAKMAVVGLTRTLAIEGKKYGILANVIAPIAASQLTATVMPKDMLDSLNPEKVAPLIAYLSSKQSSTTGKIFEAGAGWYAQTKWERGAGVVFKTDSSFTPAAVRERWSEVTSFGKTDNPEFIGDSDFLGKLNESKAAPSNKSSGDISFKGQTVLITGAGNGLGRAYAHLYAKGGANVVINDMVEAAAKKVAKEVEDLGGKAAVAIGSTEEGQKLVKAAIDAFGSIQILVLNAGILRDKSFAAMTEEQWDIVYNVHLRGTYAVAKAAWPLLQAQKYGKIITTTSAVGLHGNFGQAQYSSAKSGIIGLSKTLAREGEKYNITVNCVAPNAGTQLTATVFTEEMLKAFSPDFVAPIVVWLTAKENRQNFGLYEVSGGWVAPYRFIQSKGAVFPAKHDVTPEDIQQKLTEITRFGADSTRPTSGGESTMSAINAFKSGGDVKAKL